MRLTLVGYLAHRLVAPGALHITHTVVGLADAGITAVQQVGHPGFLELLGFPIVKPQTLATGALVDDDLAVQHFHGALRHNRITFWAVHLVLLTTHLLLGPFA